MAKVVVKTKIKKVKKKFPVVIQAPAYLNSVKIGESYVTDLNLLVGNTAKVNLMYITGNLKNQNVRLVLTINEVSSGLAKTQVSSYTQIPYYLGRFVKSGSDLIEDSFVITSKDGVNIRVKPFIITKMNTSKMILTTIRLKSRELLEAEISTRDYEEFISSVISSKIQNGFRSELKKIFPIKSFEFKKVEIEQ